MVQEQVSRRPVLYVRLKDYLLTRWRQNTICAYEHTLAAPPPDPRRAHAHAQHRRKSRHLLLPVQHTAALAHSPPVYRVRALLQRGNVGRALSAERLVSPTTRLVALRILLSGPSTPFAGVGANEKVHFWLPPTWNHLTRCFCCLCHGSSRLLAAVPWYH